MRAGRTLPLNPHPVRTIKFISEKRGGIQLVHQALEALGCTVITRHCSIDRLLGNQPKPFLQTLANFMEAM